MRTLLWWGRSDAGYSRNRILRGLLTQSGWRIIDFPPRFSALGDWEAALRRLPQVDLVWVPCFRQRDMAAAARYCRRNRLPLLFDPLISAYDKRVFEQTKLTPGSPAAERLRRQESHLFGGADLVLADTTEHARFFVNELGVSPDKARVVHVGAEESRFHARPLVVPPADAPLRVLFYGSFLPLHGPMTIVEAARRCIGQPVTWTLLGDGALKPACVEAAKGLENLTFIDWVAYEKLPDLIHAAHVVLGVFGETPKAGRVIPNKVFQSLACGRPVITRLADAYAPPLTEAKDSGILWVPAADPAALAKAVTSLSGERERLPLLAEAARATYEQHFSNARLARELADALARLGFT